MNALEELQNKPREKRTPLEQCIVDATTFEEAEHDGEIELMEQAAEDLAFVKVQLLDRAQNAHDAYQILEGYGHANTHKGKFDKCSSPPCVTARTALVALDGAR